MDNVWEQLTQDFVIDAVSNVTDIPLSGLVIKRNSYINRVFELEEKASKNRLIVKFYRPDRWTQEMILEEHFFIKELFELDNHVIPPLEFDGKTLFEHDGICFALFPKKGGRALDEFDKEGWINIGQLIGKMHLVGAEPKSSKRVIWAPDTATAAHAKTIIKLKAMPEDFVGPFKNTVANLIKVASDNFAAHSKIRLHGDIHRGNFIHRPGEGTYVVDFDDMCVGPPVQDMWMLLPDKIENCVNEIEWFISGYETFSTFDRSSLEFIPYLRAMRMIHFASWCAVQKDDPGFEIHFPEWGTKKYWGQLIRDVDELIYG
ncbi:MAG: serine/threonine protein kinase [Candidatus Margulisiibacteriota bacterium]